MVDIGTKRGVSNHTKEGVKIYERLVHPPRQFRKKIAKSLLKELQERIPEKKIWRIFEPGIGGGWLTLELLSLVAHSHDDLQDLQIDLVGVDTCPQMLKYFVESMGGTNGESDIEFPLESCFRNNSRLRVSLHNREAIEFVGQQPQNHCTEKYYDIVFCFFLLHHLDNWETGLKQITSVLGEDGLIVVSEIQGDQAAWSASFDKILRIDYRGAADARMKYIWSIKKFQEACEEIGWYNYIPVTASSVASGLEWLENNGFKGVCTITAEYCKTVCLKDWCKAGGLEPLTNGDYQRVFSVFPVFDNDSERGSFKLKWREALGLEGQEFESFMRTEVGTCDKLVYYLYQREKHR